MENTALNGDFRKKMAASVKAAFEYIEQEAEKNGVSVSRVCETAGVNRQAWQRWKDNPPYSFNTFCRMIEAIDQIEREQEVAPHD